MSDCIWQAHGSGRFADPMWGTHPMSDTDREAYLLHLADCAACSEALEVDWRSHPLGLALSPPPDVTPPDTLRAQRRLLRAVNQNQAGGYFIALLTQGLVQSVLTLLEPVFGMLLGSEASAAD